MPVLSNPNSHGAILGELSEFFVDEGRAARHWWFYCRQYGSTSEPIEWL